MLLSSLTSPDLRVSDTDRDAVADLLKRHYAAGRLTEHELSTRVDAAYHARRDSQLAVLTRDLPAFDTPPSAPSRLRQLRRGSMALAALVALVVIAAALPAEMWVVFVVLTVPMLVMLAVVLIPAAIVVMGFVWVGNVLRGPRRPSHPRP